jgi:hypothetical protein
MLSIKIIPIPVNIQRHSAYIFIQGNMSSTNLFDDYLHDEFDGDLFDLPAEIIQPPPTSRYNTFNEARLALLAHSQDNGYGISLHKSKPYYTNVRTKFYYQCDRAREYISRATKSKTGTRTTCCPFRVKIIETKDGLWMLEAGQPTHNHPPSLNPAAHRVHRKRTAAEKEKILEMSRAGVPPRQTLIALRQYSVDTLISLTDIYSEIKMARDKELGPRKPIEALLDDLSTDEWVYEVKKDAENRIQSLFFAHKKQIQQLRANPDILMIDCTYKTNRFRLPLMHIVGYSNLDSWFSAGFCFIANEKEEDYLWAVATYLRKTKARTPKVFVSDQEKALKNAVSTLLPSVPQLLCVWHANRNVQTKAQHVWRTADAETPEEKQQLFETRKEFMSRWSQVVYTKTIEAFDDAWAKLLRDYSSQPSLCTYLQDYQYPLREQWAIAWTSRHRNYGTVATSAIEGKHKVLKMYLGTAQGDLRRTVDVIKGMVLNQFSTYEKDLATARFSIKHEYTKGDLFAENIHQYITPPALNHVLEQDKLRRENLKDNSTKPCTGRFEKIYGIPCSHTIQEILSRGSRVSVLAFKDQHWHFHRDPGPSFTATPRPNQITRNPNLPKPRGKRLHRATIRDPSQFERTVPPTKPPASRSVLQEILEEIEADRQRGSQPATAPVSVAVSIPISLAMTAPVAAPVSFSAPVTISVPVSVTTSPGASPDASPQFSPISVTVSVPVSITLTPPPQSPDPPPPYSPITTPEEAAVSPPPTPPTPKPDWYPTLEEFVADIERRRGQADIQDLPIGRDAGAGISKLWAHLKDIGQEKDRMELVVAREHALATTGQWATATPEIVWSFFFGDQTAWQRWRNQTRHCWLGGSTGSTRSLGRPQRSTARKASAVWEVLSPRKRQRRQ